MSSEAPEVAGRELSWQELGAVLEEKDLTPGYSMSTGRAFVTVDGVLLWAQVGEVTLRPWAPGGNRLQCARLKALSEQLAAERAAEWDAASPDQRERIVAERRRFEEMPDPPGWQMDRVLEREGRL